MNGAYHWSYLVQQAEPVNWLASCDSEEVSIADDHAVALRWGTDSFHNGPPSEHYGAVSKNQFIANGIVSDKASAFSFKCKFCGVGITFVNKKPIDRNGAHKCLANGTGKDTR